MLGEGGGVGGGGAEQSLSVLVLTCGIRRVLESEEKRSSLDGVYARKDQTDTQGIV